MKMLTFWQLIAILGNVLMAMNLYHFTGYIAWANIVIALLNVIVLGFTYFRE